MRIQYVAIFCWIVVFIPPKKPTNGLHSNQMCRPIWWDYESRSVPGPKHQMMKWFRRKIKNGKILFTHTQTGWWYRNMHFFATKTYQTRRRRMSTIQFPSTIHCITSLSFMCEVPPLFGFEYISFCTIVAKGDKLYGYILGNNFFLKQAFKKKKC